MHAYTCLFPVCLNPLLLSVNGCLVGPWLQQLPACTESKTNNSMINDLYLWNVEMSSYISAMGWSLVTPPDLVLHQPIKLEMKCVTSPGEGVYVGTS